MQTIEVRARVIRQIYNNGDYYIFNEKGAMNYELFLDTYTVDVPKVVETYNNSDDSKKVKLRNWE